jgi:hypothetical protein
VKTIVAVYAPKGATLLGATSEGKQFPLNWGKLDGYPAGLITLPLTPGQSTTVQVQFLGKAPSDADMAVDTTPGVHATKIYRLDFDCESALK